MTRRHVGAPVEFASYGVTAMAFNAAGTELALAVGSGGTELWKATSEGLVSDAKRAACDGQSAGSVAFITGTNLVATGDAATPQESTAGCLQLWNTTGGTSQNVTLPSGALSVAFSPASERLAVGIAGHGVDLWNMTNGQPAGSILSGVSVDGVAFSPDGKTLATGAANVQLWNVATLQADSAPLPGHPFDIDSLSFSADGQFLAEGSDGPEAGPALLWNVTTRQQASIPLAGGILNEVNTVAFYPHQPTVAVATNDGTQFWDASALPASADGPALGLPATISAKGASAVLFSPDGRLLAVADPNASDAVDVLNAVTRKVVAVIPANATLPAGSVQGLAFSPDGTTLSVLSVTGKDGSAQRWRLRPGTPTALGTRVTFQALPASTFGQVPEALSPDGSALLVPGNAGLELWNLAGGAPAETVFGPKKASSVQFSANGAEAAVTTGNDTQLWNVRTQSSVGAEITTDANPWVLSPSGKTLAENDASVAVDLFSTSSGEELGTGLSSIAQTLEMTFSPDGRILAIAGYAGIQLWDVATGQVVGATLPEAPGPSSIALDPTGTELATATDENGGPALLWDVSPLTPAGAVPSLCTEAGQSLNQTQWAQYAPGTPYQNVCPSNS